MKYLSIDNGKGYYYCLKEGKWIEIDKIGKDDLMILLDNLIDTEFEMDEYQTEKLGNTAHQVIYRNLFNKFSDLLKNKRRFKDDCAQLYKSAIEKYSKELPSENS